ncbi:MAG: lysostaphin resistance A-like protein [Haloarculaceae archaeon]
MTQWAPFVWFAGFVLTGFLVLARLSQRVVGDPPRRAPGGRPDTRTEATAARDGPEATGNGPAGAPETTGTGNTGATGSDHNAPDPAAMSPAALVANVALTQGLFGVILAAAAWYFRIPGDALGLGGGRVTGAAALAVGAGFGVALWGANELATGLVDAVSPGYDERLRSLLAPADSAGWALLLGVALPVVAVVEEFLFRAVAIGVPAAAFSASPWALAVVSSAAFALGHGAQGRVGIAVTGALGSALAAGFVLTGSLLVVVVAHYLVNALEFGLHEGVGLPDPVWG